MHNTFHDKSHTCSCIPLLVIKLARNMQSSFQINHSCSSVQVSSLFLLLCARYAYVTSLSITDTFHLPPSSSSSSLPHPPSLLLLLFLLLFAFNSTALDTWSMVNVRSKSIDLFHLQENKIILDPRDVHFCFSLSLSPLLLALVNPSILLLALMIERGNV